MEPGKDLEKRYEAPRGIARRVGSSIMESRRAILGTFLVVVSFLVVLFLLGFLRIIDLTFIITFLGTGTEPAERALILTMASFVVGFVCAMPIGMVRAYAPGILRRRKGQMSEVLSYRRAKELYGGWKAVRVVGGRKAKTALLSPVYGFATGYVEAMRGTPFYVQMWIVYYAVGTVAPRFMVLGQDVFFWTGLLALTLNTAGYQSEVLRAGFQSVGQGQIEAGKAIGLKGRQIFSRITLPQSLRLVVLPLTNEWISLFKASSILSYISVFELFLWSSSFIAYAKGRPLEAFVMLAIFYLVIIVPLSRAVTYLEQKKRIPGLGTPLSEAVGKRRRGTAVALGRAGGVR